MLFRAFGSKNLARLKSATLIASWSLSKIFLLGYNRIYLKQRNQRWNWSSYAGLMSRCTIFIVKCRYCMASAIWVVHFRIWLGSNGLFCSFAIFIFSFKSPPLQTKKGNCLDTKMKAPVKKYQTFFTKVFIHQNYLLSLNRRKN